MFTSLFRIAVEIVRKKLPHWQYSRWWWLFRRPCLEGPTHHQTKKWNDEWIGCSEKVHLKYSVIFVVGWKQLAARKTFLRDQILQSRKISNKMGLAHVLKFLHASNSQLRGVLKYKNSKLPIRLQTCNSKMDTKTGNFEKWKEPCWIRTSLMTTISLLFWSFQLTLSPLAT